MNNFCNEGATGGKPIQISGEEAGSLLLKQTRRKLLTGSVGSLGAMALGGLLNETFGASSLASTQFPPKVKRVIHLCMAGGPSHLETFDYKPILARLDGKAMPESVTKGQPIAQLQGKELKILGPQTSFSRCGKSGLEISDVMPNIQKLADDICIIKSMVSEQINHDPAHTYFNTGSRVMGAPSMGSWLLYGLGRVNQDLPGFIVLTSEGGGGGQPIAARQWSSGFLSSKFQGVQLNSKGDPVYYVGSPDGVDSSRQNQVLSAVNQLNHTHAKGVNDPEIEQRIAQYELAFRMQMSVPNLVDFSKEDPRTIAMYGCRPGDGSFASNCLLARRLAERGTRFIQLYHRGWDHHRGIHKGIRSASKHVDQGAYALITDLKRLGLLDETLVIFSGEFGRTPMMQGSGDAIGRDHHIKGFSAFLCGGGIKPGASWGATDDLGYHAVENPVNVRDLHATMLHLCGIDHSRLTFRHMGLDAKLTGVEPAQIVKGILA